MPTPIGHALGAFAAGWVVAGPPQAPTAERASPPQAQPQLVAGQHPRFWARAALLATIGVAADIDLLFGAHSAYTHSVGAAAVVAISVGIFSRNQRLRLALAAAAAYLTHIAFDLLGQDTSMPLGVMAFWPFSTEHFHSGLDLFFATDRRYWLPGFWVRNLTAVAWELALLAPLAAGAWWLRRRRPPPA